MPTTSWNVFQSHHRKLAANWPNGATSKTKSREISAVWKDLGTRAAKAREATSIRNDPSRTLAQSRAAVLRIARDIPPASPPPAPLSPAYIDFLLGRDNRYDDADALVPLDGDSAKWLGGWSIGGREPNKACPWYRVGDDGNIEDRKIVKDTYLQNILDWTDLTRWTKDPRQNGLPMEFILHQRLLGTNGGEHFAAVRGCRVFTRRWMYRFVMEYCDQRDSQELLKRCSKANSMVPEPFLWRLLESMALACKTMEEGAIDGAVNGWKQIIHRDLKADNVFLASQAGTHYPTPKIADFEFAYETTENDPFNPAIWREQSFGHRISQAPEAHQYVNRDLIGSQILSPANVWCIGITMWQLMNNKLYNNSVNARWDEDEYKDYNRWGENPENVYSQPLLKAVRACLEFSPTDRATPQGLLGQIAANANHVDAGPCIAARNAVSENDAGFQWQWAYRGIQDAMNRAWADVLSDRESFEQQQAEEAAAKAEEARAKAAAAAEAAEAAAALNQELEEGRDP